MEGIIFNMALTWQDWGFGSKLESFGFGVEQGATIVE